MPWSEEERKGLDAALFQKAHFTTNQRVRIVEWLSDLKKIKKSGLGEILSDGSLQKILGHPRLDPRSRGKKLFERIRTLRFPNVSRALKGNGEETLL